VNGMGDSWVENRRHVKGYPHRRSVHIRRSVLASLLRVCGACGETDEGKLVVDHINRNSLDNRPENLQVLCRRCHRDKTPQESPYAALLRHDAASQTPASHRVHGPRRRPLALPGASPSDGRTGSP
jgi:5-methylcytosine-specific restriction endonuclease McrA